jgi:hypothetical protein
MTELHHTTRIRKPNQIIRANFSQLLSDHRTPLPSACIVPTIEVAELSVERMRAALAERRRTSAEVQLALPDLGNFLLAEMIKDTGDLTGGRRSHEH